MKHGALFLDRDGTLVHPFHYPSRPDQLRLYEGIAPALIRLQDAGFQLIIITNQAGIARGYFDEAALQVMHKYLTAELAQLGVQVHAIYHCPHHPEGVVPELAIRCECRKPQPGMLLRASAEHDIDLNRSWFVGDILDDIEAGNRAGCRTVLVDLGTEKPPEQEIRRPDLVARDTEHALAMICAQEGLAPAPEMTYAPQSWQTFRKANA